MGSGGSVHTAGYRGTLPHLEHERWIQEFARIEGKRRMVADRMFAAARASTAWQGRARELHQRVEDAKDRLYPFPSREDVEHLPLPVWVADGRLTCEGCGTLSSRVGHLEGCRITGCSNCFQTPRLTGERAKPAQES